MARKRLQKKPTRKNRYYTTPQKAKVQGAIEYLRAKGIAKDPRNIFSFFNVEERSGYKMIEADAPSRNFHNQDLNETRGRKAYGMCRP